MVTTAKRRTLVCFKSGDWRHWRWIDYPPPNRFNFRLLRQSGETRIPFDCIGPNTEGVYLYEIAKSYTGPGPQA